jgi:hypothetical protein
VRGGSSGGVADAAELAVQVFVGAVVSTLLCLVLVVLPVASAAFVVVWIGLTGPLLAVVLGCAVVFGLSLVLTLGVSAVRTNDGGWPRVAGMVLAPLEGLESLQLLPPAADPLFWLVLSVTGSGLLAGFLLAGFAIVSKLRRPAEASS